MTVSTINSVAEFVTNGATKTFPFYFKFLDSRDLVVTYIDPEDVSTVLVMGTHYTVSGAGNDKGGSVTTTAVLPGPGKLIVFRDMEAYQKTSLRNQGKFLAETHEDVFDRLTMLSQQGFAGLKRALSKPLGREYFHAEEKRIVGLADPESPKDAATKDYTDDSAAGVINYTDARLLRTVRSVDGETLTQLPAVASRANKVMGFDANGQPIGVLPASGSGTEVAIDLANGADPNKGTGMVKMDDRWLRDYLKQQEYYLTIEYFGPTDTPANTKATMQAAINFCAANGVLLRNKSSSYTIDISSSGVTIPNNFMCDFGGAWVRRATGNKTPHDMWVNADEINGNTGLDIRGVNFDGRAREDDLSNEFPAHRFCGLRLIKCSGKISNVRVDSTCNGEIQAEGIRGGILLQDSVFMDCQGVRTDNNIGTGLFITGGRGRLSNFQANNNTGSGLSGDQPGWMFESLRSVGSGYSGISLNGPGWTARGIYASGAAFGFAGVNFGHTTPVSSNGVGAVASDVVAENNASWGINATSCPGLQGSNWVSRKSGDNNIRLISSPGVKISLASEDAGANGLLIDGAGHYDIDAHVSGSRASGVYGRNGANIVLSSGSLITGNGLIGGFAAEVTLETASRAIVCGKVLDGKAYGVQSSDSSILTVAGGTVKGNAFGNVRSATGGVIRYENAKFSDDPMSGVFTILPGTNFIQVLNGNFIDPNRIVVTPATTAARAAGVPILVTYTVGVSFTMQLAGNATADCGYRWNIT